MVQKKLSTFPFVDLYICIEGGQPAHHRASMKGITTHPDIVMSPEYSEDINNLTQYILDHLTQDQKLLQYDGMRLRGAFINASNGEKWVTLRKVKDRPPSLDSLGFPPALVSHLQSLGKREGLILICGATGQGKTTTSCSLLVDFMTRYGEVGFTIEDPVEYNLAGRHGDAGYCYQVDVNKDEEWSEALTNSLRCHPRYIFLGEVSSPDVANQLLRAATSGHLVITTMHGGSPQEGLEGILQLAEQKIGSLARHLLASSLTALIHQTLGRYGLTPSFLITEQAGRSSSVRTLIRENQIGQINSLIDKQNAKLMLNGEIF